MTILIRKYQIILARNELCLRWILWKNIHFSCSSNSSRQLDDLKGTGPLKIILKQEPHEICTYIYEWLVECLWFNFNLNFWTINSPLKMNNTIIKFTLNTWLVNYLNWKDRFQSYKVSPEILIDFVCLKKKHSLQACTDSCPTYNNFIYLNFIILEYTLYYWNINIFCNIKI